MKAGNVAGDVRVYGSPAEEGGPDKLCLVRAGLVRDVDVALHGHPNDASQSRWRACNRMFATAGGIITPAVTATGKIYNEPRVYGVQARFTFGRR